MDLSRCLESRENNVATSIKASTAVSFVLLSVAVSLVTPMKTMNGSKLVCDSVCENCSIRSIIGGIASKRHVEYGWKKDNLLVFSA